MPRRRSEATAAGLLGTWTDADTAMQLVGTSLGLFGEGMLDADAVLAEDTPLRNALFDVLLSLVEGGALEMRPTEDGHYGFRWRADMATAALSPDTEQTIDIEAPSPYLDELIRVRRERDDALGRADFAEALAAEQERLLRLASAPVPATRPKTQPERPAPVPGLDSQGQSVLDVLVASRQEAEAQAQESAPPDADAKKPKPRKPAAKARKPASKTRKPASKTRKPAPKANNAKAAPPDPPDEPASNDVLYLARPDDDGSADRPRWSGYTLDTPRPRLSTVRLADEA